MSILYSWEQKQFLVLLPPSSLFAAFLWIYFIFHWRNWLQTCFFAVYRTLRLSQAFAPSRNYVIGSAIKDIRFSKLNTCAAIFIWCSKLFVISIVRGTWIPSQLVCCIAHLFNAFLVRSTYLSFRFANSGVFVQLMKSLLLIFVLRLLNTSHVIRVDRVFQYLNVRL